MTLDQALRAALEHHQAGRLQPAEALYRQVLAAQPNNVDALRLLGLLAASVGQHAAGLELIERAVKLAPQSELCRAALAEACAAQGDACADQHRLDEAIACYQRSIDVDPRAAMVWNNLGVVLQLVGRVEQAIEKYRRAIAMQPDYPEAHNNLSDALRLTGNLDEALSAAQAAVRLRPNYPEALHNLGNALLHLRRREEALSAYDAAIALRPNFAWAFNDRGNALTALGREDEALESYRRAVQYEPRAAQLLSNFGNALRNANQLEQSLAMHRSAVAADPKIPEIHVNLGNALRDAGEIPQAIAAYRTAIALRPSFAAGWDNLLFTLPFDPALTGEQILAEHQRWAQSQTSPPPRPDRLPKRRLRIGYVSPDFRDHPVGRFMLPLLANHDRHDFEIFCYADVAREDDVTRELRAHANTWRDTMSLDDDRLTDQIRADRIDILVDLAVHSAHNRLLVFARRAAPVQVTYLGYPGTTGLTAMDYRLTDRFLDPPDDRRTLYSERSMRLATTYWCYAAPADAPPVSPPPMRQNGSITFGCLNTLAKVSPRALQAWRRILDATPGARLILHASGGAHLDRAREMLGERVECVPRLSMTQYLATYGRLDIALDPFPVGGGTTTCDALWMGVPVISLTGDIAARRTGASILPLVGLADLVTGNVDDYIAAAVALANDPTRITDIRTTLRDRMQNSPLMDGPAFARDIERCYREMWTAT